MNEEKIKEVFSNEEFVKSLLKLETPEEVRKALDKKDISLSIDEIDKIAELIQKQAGGELSDEDLENVAGGLGAITVLAIYEVVKVTLFAASLTNYATRRRW